MEGKHHLIGQSNCCPIVATRPEKQIGHAAASEAAKNIKTLSEHSCLTTRTINDERTIGPTNGVREAPREPAASVQSIRRVPIVSNLQSGCFLDRSKHGVTI